MFVVTAYILDLFLPSSCASLKKKNLCAAQAAITKYADSVA